jgi:ABC-2 type transport system ATP-binding protein
VREFVRRLNRDRGVTVILTTHDMDDIEQLCSRVVVIAGGRVLADGSLESLRAQVMRERWLILDLERADDRVDDPDAQVIARDGARVTVAYDPARVPTSALIARITSTAPVRDLFVQDPPIEEVVSRLYQSGPGPREPGLVSAVSG